MDKKIKEILKYSGLILYSMLILSLGFIIGMIYGETLLISSVGEALSYTNMNIEININESKLVEELRTSFIPILKETLNQTTNMRVIENV